MLLQMYNKIIVLLKYINISYNMMVLYLNIFAILKVIFFVHAKYEFINHLILQKKKMINDKMYCKDFLTS